MFVGTVKILLLPAPYVATRVFRVLFHFPTRGPNDLLEVKMTNNGVTLTAKYSGMKGERAINLFRHVGWVRRTVASANSGVSDLRTTVLRNVVSDLCIATYRVRRVSVVARTNTIKDIVIVTGSKRLFRLSSDSLEGVKRRVIKGAVKVFASAAAFI